MTHYFDVVNSYLGWGDPASGGIWFVGLEEAGVFEESREIEELEKRLNGRCYEYVDEGVLRQQCKEHKEKYGNTYTPTHLIMSKIAVWSGFEKEYEDPKEYWFNKLFQKGSKVFQSNLFPLGKNSWGEKFPGQYKEFFGFDNDKQSRTLYEKKVRENRWEELKKLWKEGKPYATICFGKIGWGHFRKIFDLKEADCRADSGIEVYESQQVFFAPFFVSHQMGTVRIELLSEYVRKMIQR